MKTTFSSLGARAVLALPFLALASEEAPSGDPSDRANVDADDMNEETFFKNSFHEMMDL